VRFLLVLLVLAVLAALVVKTILVNRRASGPEALRASPCEDLEPASHTAGRPRRPRRGDLVDRRRRFPLSGRRA
jgi:hypothetical protein